jgi:hypothetical protein
LPGEDGTGLVLPPVDSREDFFVGDGRRVVFTDDLPDFFDESKSGEASL